VGGVSIADIVSDELYIVRYLMPGRIAPEFKGADVAGRIVQLSDLRGKAAVVLFWDAASPDTRRIIDFTNKLVSKHTGDKMTILGITPEPLDQVRSMQGDGSIKWNNIIDTTDKLAKEYRVVARPLMMILSASGKIEYLGQPNSFAELTLDSLIQGKTEK
jgi:peroxiredoxin